jgi:protein MPE1
VQGLQPEDPDLTCPIDSKLLRDAVKTPCCSTSFCEPCITKYLTEHDFVCPECESKVKSLEKLKPDEDRRQRVADYVQEMVHASKEADAEVVAKDENAGDSPKDVPAVEVTEAEKTEPAASVEVGWRSIPQMPSDRFVNSRSKPRRQLRPARQPPTLTLRRPTPFLRCRPSK